MKPGDIAFYEDTDFCRHRFWRIEGVFFGASGRESLVELRSLSPIPGGAYGKTVETMMVPKALLRGKIFTPAAP